MCVSVCVGKEKGGGSEEKVVEIKIENKSEQFHLKGFNFLTTNFKMYSHTHRHTFSYFFTHPHTHTIFNNTCTSSN